MRTNSRFKLLGVCLFLLVMSGTVLLTLVPEAYAVYGTRRRTARRTAIVVSSANDAETAAAEQEAADANAEAAAANARADSTAAAAAAAQAAQPAPAPAPAPAATGAALPLGAMVDTLPEGCTKTTIGGVEYYYNGLNYFRAAFQGSKLVYVTTQP